VADLVLTRTDKRLYSLDGVGTLSPREGVLERGDGPGGREELALRLPRMVPPAHRGDRRDGPADRTFESNRGFRRGGTVRWERRDFTLQSRSTWKAQRFALLEGDRDMAVFEGRAYDRRPVTVSIEPGALDAGLLLFVAFVVRGLVLDAFVAVGSAAAAGAGA
jgi:hypothetical protein